MKRLIAALLVVLGVCAPAQAAIAIGQHTFSSVNTGGLCAGDTSVTTGSLATSASGSVFWVYASTTAAGWGATPVSDNKSNSYSSIETWTFNGVLWRRDQVTNGTGGAGHTFTATGSGAGCMAIFVLEITGAATSTALDAHPAAATDASTPIDSSNSGTLAQAAEILVGSFGDDSMSGTCTHATGNGFTLLDSATDSTKITAATGYKIVAATTSDHSEFTSTGCGATQGTVTVDSFKEAAAAGATAKRLLLLGVG